MQKTIYIMVILLFQLNCGILEFGNQDKEDEDKEKTLLGLLAIAGQRNASLANTTDSTTGTTQQTVADPTFSPTAGNQSTGGNVTISTTTEDAKIHYTTNGTDPTSESTEYSAPLQNLWILAGKTIKAIGIKTDWTNSAVVSAVYTIQPLKTGQDTCWNSGSNATADCSTVPNHDGALKNGTTRSYTGPTQHATHTTDYTTTDNATGLVWKTCSEGQSGATCGTGTITGLTYANATTACTNLNSANSGAGYAGIKNWRVPSRDELATLSDYGKAAPAINTTAFPTAGNGNYWTSNETPWVNTHVYSINFNDSVMHWSDKTATDRNVRCVSGSARETARSFTDNGDGTVKDNLTGLIWQKCTKGRTGSDCSGGSLETNTYADALTYCAGLTTGSKTWRVPNINELHMLLDITKTQPYLDTTIFPNSATTVNLRYWSSTTSKNGPTDNYFLSFWDGSMSGVGKTTSTNMHTRCVTGP